MFHYQIFSVRKCLHKNTLSWISDISHQMSSEKFSKLGFLSTTLNWYTSRFHIIHSPIFLLKKSLFRFLHDGIHSLTRISTITINIRQSKTSIVIGVDKKTFEIAIAFSMAFRRYFVYRINHRSSGFSFQDAIGCSVSFFWNYCN